MLLFLATLFLSITISVCVNESLVETPCEANWSYYNGTNKCYYKHFNGTDLNGYQAMALCESLNATLTSIHSQAEMNWIIGLTLPLPDNKPFYAYWIGLYDRNMSYNWQWLDGTPVNYFHWNPNEPDDYRHLDFPIDFELSGFFPPGGVTAKEWSSEGLWVDYYPGYGLTGAICIKDSNIKVNLSGTKLYAPEVWVESDIGCGDGWVGLSQTSKCYRVVTQSMDYFEVTKECEKLDATLVAIHSDNENAFLLKITMNHTAFNSNLTDNFYWIGFNDHYNTIQWTWLDGTPANYFHWGELEPQYQGVLMSLACAVLIVDTKDRDYFTRRWKWMVSFCDTKQQGAICQKRIKIDPSTSANSISTISTTITGFTESSLTTTTTTQPATTTAPIDCPVNESNPCDCGWTYYEPANKCFYATIQAMNYADALNFCNNSDSVLASIHTRDEHNFLFNLSIPEDARALANLYFYSPSSYNYHVLWIGLVDHNMTNNWTWLDGTPTNYFFWGHYDPSAHQKYSYHLDITPVAFAVGGAVAIAKANNRRWIDSAPNEIYQGAICQKYSKLPTNTSSEYFLYKVAPIFDSDLACEKGWYGFEQTCYMPIVKNLNFFSAIQECAALNSTVASIHDMETNEFLQKLPVSGIFLPVYAFWIGLVDHNNSGNWNWVDGTKFDFAYWSIFEPNWQGFRPMNITCVILVVNAINVVYAERLSKWADTYCESEFQGVFCQKEAMNKSKMPSPTKRPQINQTIQITISSDKRMSDHYSSSLNQIDCFEPPSNRETASMIVARDTKHYDLYRTMDPIAICPCPEGNRMYWPSSNDSLPKNVYDSSELAFILYDYVQAGENALFDGVHSFCSNGSESNDCVEKRDFCPNMCICDTDGICYQSFKYNAEVLFVPYCDGENEERECFVYAVSSLGDLCRLCAFYDIMNKCDDCVNLNATTDRVGFNSSYIRVEKVGCNGCPELVNIRCPEQANNGTPGWPSIIDITRSNISNLTYTRADSGVTVRGIWFRENDCGHGIICSQVATQRSSLDQLSNWRPYVLHPDIINTNYATDALRDIIYECTFFYGLHGELVNNQDIQNGIVPSFDVTKSLFDDNARELMETLMERALRYENFSSIGGECSALNYERFASIKQNVHEKWLKSIDSFDNFRMINMVLVPAFGIPGLGISIGVIMLIRKNTELLTPFGVICLIQACNDIILLLNSVVLEGANNIKFVLTDKSDSNNYISIFGWRPDRLTFYIFYSTKISVSIFTFIKAFSRFIAVYQPVFFYVYGTTKRMRNFSLVTWSMMFIISLPLLVFPNWCKTVFDRSQYLQLDGCASYYWWVETYGEYALTIICFILDIATAIKIFQARKAIGDHHDENQHKKKKQEHLFILQNFGNLATCVILLIPNIIYALPCKFDRWHCIAGGSNSVVNSIYQISVLLFLYNSRVVIWRCFDGLVTLAFQRRILRLLNFKPKSSNTSTQPLQYPELDTSFFYYHPPEGIVKFTILMELSLAYMVHIMLIILYICSFVSYKKHGIKSNIQKIEARLLYQGFISAIPCLLMITFHHLIRVSSMSLLGSYWCTSHRPLVFLWFNKELRKDYMNTFGLKRIVEKMKKIKRGPNAIYSVDTQTVARTAFDMQTAAKTAAISTQETPAS